MDIAFKIALFMCVILCGVVIVLGLAVWTLTLSLMVKFALSSIAICAGVAFGAIGIGLMLEE